MVSPSPAREADVTEPIRLSKQGVPMKKTTVGAVVAALFALSMVASAPISVSADSFKPGPDAPSVTISSYPPSIAPGALSGEPEAAVVYTVSVGVTKNSVLSDLSTVTMCWYSVEAGGTDACESAGTDPTKEFLMTWTQSTNTFAKTGTNQYANASSTSTYSASAQSMTMDFKFQVSKAMSAQDDWLAKVVATDDAEAGGGSGSATTDAATTVSAYGEITSLRGEQDFTAGDSVVLKDATAKVEDFAAGTYLLNTSKDIKIAGDDFSDGNGNTLSLVSTTPGSGEVKLQCNFGSTFDTDDVDNTELTSTATKIGTLAATGEAGNSSTKMSCQLTYGGGATKAMVDYSNAVTVSIPA